MNSELAKVKKWCGINKLSINMGKTKFMMHVIKSVRKRVTVMAPPTRWSENNVKKYLGVDESLT